MEKGVGGSDFDAPLVASGERRHGPKRGERGGGVERVRRRPVGKGGGGAAVMLGLGLSIFTEAYGSDQNMLGYCVVVMWTIASNLVSI